MEMNYNSSNNKLKINSTIKDNTHRLFYDEETLHNIVLSGKFQSFHKSQVAAAFKENHFSPQFLEVRESQDCSDSEAKNQTDFQGGLLISCKGSKKLLEEVLRECIPCCYEVKLWKSNPITSIWFPRHIMDLKQCQTTSVLKDPDVKLEHPGFQDKTYRKRRDFIANLAKNHKIGDAIPYVDYTEAETNTWRTVYNALIKKHKKWACSEYLRNFNQLEEKGLYSPDVIPQLQDVSNHLKSCSGYQLCPVPGLLSARDFLASLAFRVFYSTQYLRHHSSPMHTPEPDCCHELLGHVPMFCDPIFADFSQEVGLASLGASDEDIEKLSTLYWFTIEVGLCKENGKLKAYGAALLSSVGEFEHALSGAAEYLPLDVQTTSLQPYQDETYQPLYYVSKSVEDALAQIRSFSANQITRNFLLRYNEKKESVEVFPKISSYKL